MPTEIRVNDRILAIKVMLISSEGENKGQFTRADALVIARESGMDLIQVSYPTNGELPVCKIMDYGKYKYWLSKKSKCKHESVKEIRVSYRIADHDLETKNTKVSKFLAKHYKVKYVMTLKGREKYRKDAITRFCGLLKYFEGKATWQSPVASNNQVMTVLSPK